MDINELFEHTISLVRTYCTTKRKTFDPSITLHIESLDFSHYEQYYQSLFSHVGELPIIASTLHPHMDREVDLGRALQIFAVHDIGETVAGDQLSFTKVDTTEEDKAAYSLLHPSQHHLYTEYLERKTNEGKYAYSIDKITPMLLDILIGKENAKRRLSTLLNWKEEEVVEKISAYNLEKVAWSPFLTEFAKRCLKEYE